MKKLILVRHAKAARRHKHLSDIERALTPRGEKDAKRAARLIQSRGIELGIIVSSPANRALETAHIVARVLEYPVEKIALKQAAYDAPDAEGLYPILRGIEDQYETAVLIGHNPSLEELASSLVIGYDENLPKAGVVEIQLEKDSWPDVLPGDGKIVSDLPAAKNARSGSNSKELRREIGDRITIGIRELLAEIEPETVVALDPEIAKSADLLARKIAKLRKNVPAD